MLCRLAAVAALLLFAAAGLFAALGAAFRPAPVVAAEVTRGPAVATVFATAYVEPREVRALRPLRPAAVAEVFARERAEVKAGEPLLRLRDTARESRRERVQADLAMVERNLAPESSFRKSGAARSTEAAENAANAAREVERLRPLLAQGLVDKGAFDDAESRARALAERGRMILEEDRRSLDEMEARRRALAAELATVLAAEKDDILVSPLDGVVLMLAAEEGELVSPERDLVRVGDVRELILEADVDEEDIRLVRLGQEALVRLAGSEAAVARGRVYEIAPQAVRATKSCRVKVGFAEASFTAASDAKLGFAGETRLPGGLLPLPGMSAELGIIVERRADALVFPRSALTTRGTVFVVGEDDRAHERAVEVGVRNFDVCEAVRGLSAGERVVVEGAASLADGKRIAARVR
jgi:multidrug efflux pump subunit AcrA (membrane-fusion protein)